MFTKKLWYVSMILTSLCMVFSCTEESVQNTSQQDFLETISPHESIEIVPDLDQVREQIDESNVIQHDEKQLEQRSSTLYYYPSPNGGQCGANAGIRSWWSFPAPFSNRV